MSYRIRNMTKYGDGGVVEVSDPDENTYRLAIFPDSNIEDVASVDGRQFLLTSGTGDVALLDCEQREVTGRTRLPKHRFEIRHRAGLLALDGGSKAFVWPREGRSFFVLDIPSLEIDDRFSLAEKVEDNEYRLLDLTDEELRDRGQSFSTISAHDGPVRPILPSRWTKCALRADGKIVVPLRRSAYGREYVDGNIERNGITEETTRNLHQVYTEICVIDKKEKTCSFEVLSTFNGIFELSAYPFLLSLSPDGRLAVSISRSLRSGRPSHGRWSRWRPKRTGFAAPPENYGYSLDVWDITAEPKLLSQPVIQPFRGEQEIDPPSIQDEFRSTSPVPAIASLIPGLRSALDGKMPQWEESQERQIEDGIFLHPDAPKGRWGNARLAEAGLGRPDFLGPVIRLFMRKLPEIFHDMPWDIMTDRQVRVASKILDAFYAYANGKAISIAWTGSPETFLVLSKYGSVREVHVTKGVGPEYQLNLPTFPVGREGRPSLADRGQIEHVGNRTFALEIGAFRFEFEVPSAETFSTWPSAEAEILDTRLVRDKNSAGKDREAVERLIRQIRPGYIEVGSTQPREIIAGLYRLVPAIENSFKEITVGNVWEPALFSGEERIGEQAICDILKSDGSSVAVAALSALLDAFLAQQKTGAFSFWTVYHDGGQTPALAPIAFTLIELTGTVPDNVFRFFSQRDVEHDVYTRKRLVDLDLTAEQKASPALFRLRVRLAIQDIADGSRGSNLAAFFGFDHELKSLISGELDPAHFADMLAEAASAEAPNFYWNPPNGPGDLLKMIAEGLQGDQPDIAALRRELLKHAA